MESQRHCTLNGNMEPATYRDGAADQQGEDEGHDVVMGDP